VDQAGGGEPVRFADVDLPGFAVLLEPVFDMPASSDMVPFGEPFFMALDAEVEVVPVMNAEDLQNGLGKLG
jgi:hypothetical protein